jgi:hypothetical protein
MDPMKPQKVEVEAKAEHAPLHPKHVAEMKRRIKNPGKTIRFPKGTNAEEMFRQLSR